MAKWLVPRGPNLAWLSCFCPVHVGFGNKDGCGRCSLFITLNLTHFATTNHRQPHSFSFKYSHWPHGLRFNPFLLISNYYQSFTILSEIQTIPKVARMQSSCSSTELWLALTLPSGAQIGSLPPFLLCLMSAGLGSCYTALNTPWIILNFHFNIPRASIADAPQRLCSKLKAKPHWPISNPNGCWEQGGSTF